MTNALSVGDTPLDSKAFVASLRSARSWLTTSAMIETPAPIRRALLSVSDKTGIEAFARGLAERSVELISTGGTAATLKAAGLAVRDVADLRLAVDEAFNGIDGSWLAMDGAMTKAPLAGEKNRPQPGGPQQAGHQTLAPDRSQRRARRPVRGRGQQERLQAAG